MARQGSIFSVLAARIIAPASARLLAAVLAVCLCCSSVAAAELPWLNDIEKAKQVAAEQHKDLLINFTGISWCSMCVSLEREIFSTDEFAPAADKFVLVRLDYPRHALVMRDWPRLPQEPPAPKRTWAEQYGVHTWQTMFLADAKGTPYAAANCFDCEPAELATHLAELLQIHRLRDEAFEKAAKSEGIARAKHTIAGLNALRSAFVDSHESNVYPLTQFYSNEIEEVVRLDCADELVNDKSSPYRQQVALRRRIASYLAKIGRTEEALATCDEAIHEVERYAPHEKINVLTTKTDVYWHAHRYQEALEAHDAAVKSFRAYPSGWEYGYIKRIQILSRLGRAEDAWKAYDEFAESTVSKPLSRLNTMASIARLLDEAGSSEAAREAAIRTKREIASLNDPVVDTSQAQEIVNEILAPSTQSAANSDASEAAR